MRATTAMGSLRRIHLLDPLLQIEREQRRRLRTFH